VYFGLEKSKSNKTASSPGMFILIQISLIQLLFRERMKKTEDYAEQSKKLTALTRRK
jgi:hypothetical protein